MIHVHLINQFVIDILCTLNQSFNYILTVHFIHACSNNLTPNFKQQNDAQ